MDKKVIQDYLNDPKFIALQKELTDYTNSLYNVFDNTVFVGKAANGLVKVHYSYKNGGIEKIDIDPGIYKDQTLTCDFLMVAIKDASSQYAEEYKRVQALIIEKEKDIYNRMLSVFSTPMGSDISKSSSLQDILSVPKKKTYLN